MRPTNDAMPLSEKLDPHDGTLVRPRRLRSRFPTVLGSARRRSIHGVMDGRTRFLYARRFNPTNPNSVDPALEP